jgi:hypothetical protein
MKPITASTLFRLFPGNASNPGEGQPAVIAPFRIVRRVEVTTGLADTDEFYRRSLMLAASGTTAG